jgi:hypothetical protein
LGFFVAAEVELTTDEVTRLEKRAAEFGTKRTVDPSGAWGVPDLWKDAPDAKM